MDGLHDMTKEILLRLGSRVGAEEIRRKTKKPTGWLAFSLQFPDVFLVGRARFELATNGLKVRCSTD